MPGDTPRAESVSTSGAPAEHEERIPFAGYSSSIQDLTPCSLDMPPGTHPFPTAHCRRNTSLKFNIADYSRQLYTDFLVEDGRIETVEFQSPSDLQALQPKVVFNCTGYGARQLWADETIVPVRGQIGWLIPQPEMNYGIYFRNLGIVGRRDGIVVQVSNQGENQGGRTTTRLRTAKRPRAECAI